MRKGKDMNLLEKKTPPIIEKPTIDNIGEPYQNVLNHLKVEIGEINPWAVDKASAFLKYCCPECDYTDGNLTFFANHALGNHLDSNVFFTNKKLLEIKSEIGEQNFHSEYSSGFYSQSPVDASVIKKETSEIVVDENEEMYEVDENLVEMNDFKHEEFVNENFSKNGQKPVYDKEDFFSCHICQISFHQKKHYKAHITQINQDGTR